MEHMLKLTINQIIEQSMSAGFYAGQAMAGVELEQCHKNWKKYSKDFGVVKK